jgi:hypothetical protein
MTALPVRGFIILAILFFMPQSIAVTPLICWNLLQNFKVTEAGCQSGLAIKEKYPAQAELYEINRNTRITLY